MWDGFPGIKNWDVCGSRQWKWGLDVPFSQSILFKTHKYLINRYLFYKYALGAAGTFPWCLFFLRKLPAPGFPQGTVLPSFLSAQLRVPLVSLQFLRTDAKSSSEIQNEHPASSGHGSSQHFSGFHHGSAIWDDPKANPLLTCLFWKHLRNSRFLAVALEGACKTETGAAAAFLLPPLC